MKAALTCMGWLGELFAGAARAAARRRSGDLVTSLTTALVGALAGCFVGAASAQTPPPSAPPEIEEIVVTGSRIASANATSASPIQVVSTREIQATGKNDITDILNQLPQIFNNDLGQDLGNRTSGLTTAGGVSTADLRGLGPNRTLVLIDGRRLGQGSPYTSIASPAPDLDQIPIYLIDRIEVLTGGASSVYGSDAIAGVVNFILKKNFQGLQFDSQFGEDWHKQKSTYMSDLVTQAGQTPLSGNIQDGRNRTLSIIAGTNFGEGNGNVTGFLTYLHADPVSSGDRDFGQCQLDETLAGNGTVVGNFCGGSSNSNRFTPLSGPNAGTRYAVSGNSFIPWGSAATTPPAIFNSQRYIYLARQDDRYQGGLLVHESLNDYATPYMEFMFMNDRSHQAIAPTAAFTTGNPNTGNPYPVNCGNPLLSAQQQAILGCTAAQISGNQADPANQVLIQLGRRNIEGGPRTSDYEHTNYRAVVGVKGDLTKAWHYDAWGQYYYTTFFNSNDQYFNYANVDNALLVTGTRANPQCLVGAPCVPWNIFQDGGVTDAALNYLYSNGTGAGNTTLRTAHADITGQLAEYGVRLPTANEGLGVNVGFEHRNENVQFAPDSIEQTGQLAGFGGAATAINNSLAVDEEFIELRAPLLQDRPFSRDLTFGTGFRHSNYSVSGGVNTYKFDTQWAPVQDLRFRGSYQRAIRAPSIVELYNPQLLGLIQFGNDPCAPPVSAPLAQCLHTVPASQAAAFTTAYNTGAIPQAVAGQLGQVQGGNPLLQPEKAKTYSLGLLFAPQAVPSLTGSVDFWQIRLDQAVGPIPASVAMTQCLQTGNPTYCSLIVRDSFFGLSGATVAGGGYIVQSNQNIASGLTSGIDLQSSYKLDLRHMGSLVWAINGAYLLHATTQPLSGGPHYDCAGLFGLTCQTVNPRWRHNLRATWEMPGKNVDASLNWRFIGKVGNDNNDPQAQLHFVAYGAFDQALQQIPNISYIDLSFGYHGWKGVDIRGGVNNLFDRNPPLVPVTIQPGGAPNTYGTYEALGRQLYVAGTVKF